MQEVPHGQASTSWSSFYHMDTHGGLGLARCAEEDLARGSVSDIFLFKIGSRIPILIQRFLPSDWLIGPWEREFVFVPTTTLTKQEKIVSAII